MCMPSSRLKLIPLTYFTCYLPLSHSSKLIINPSLNTPTLGPIFHSHTPNASKITSGPFFKPQFSRCHYKTTELHHVEVYINLITLNKKKTTITNRTLNLAPMYDDLDHYLLLLNNTQTTVLTTPFQSNLLIFICSSIKYYDLDAL